MIKIVIKERFNQIIRDHYGFFIILLISIILRLFNLNGYPHIFIDENLYTARAWSFLKYQVIDIYPLGYDYDHPFLGWFLIGLISSFSPGTLFIEKARFSMIIFSTVQILLVYLITLKLFNRKSSAIVSTFVMGFTMQYIEISRMVLIDNVATVFLLLTILVFYKYKRSYSSSIILGFTCWIKYTYSIFSIGFLFLFLITNIKNYSSEGESGKILNIVNKSIVMFIKWITPCILIFLLWPLFAIIQSEFFINNGNYSLLGRFIGNFISRGGSPFWDSNGYFIQSTRFFTDRNVFIFVLPSISLLLSLIILKLNKNSQSFFKILPIIGFLVPYYIFLMRGGVTFFFYYIPIFPLLSMISGVLPFIITDLKLMLLKNKENKTLLKRKIYYIQVFYVIFIIISLFYPFTFIQLHKNNNQNLLEMKDWVSENMDRDSVYVTCAQFLPEFHELGFNDYYLYWRCVSIDPVFNSTVLKGDWRNIDYFILDVYVPDILNSLPYQNEQILLTAFINSNPIMIFGENTEQITIYEVNHSI